MILEIELRRTDFDSNKFCFEDFMISYVIIMHFLISFYVENTLQESYNTGDYINAVVNRQKAEIISNVLYPDDRSYQVYISKMEARACMCVYTSMSVFDAAPTGRLIEK